MRGLTPLQKFHRHATTTDRRPRLGMTPREYARFLHEECFVSYTEACQRAGYSPEEDHQRQVKTFLGTIAVVLLTAVVLTLTVS